MTGDKRPAWPPSAKTSGSGADGSAFLLPDGAILTCAHCVVERSDEKELPNETPANTVMVSVAGGAPFGARVAPGGWAPLDDVAVLRATGPLPAETAALIPARAEQGKFAQGSIYVASPWRAGRAQTVDIEAKPIADATTSEQGHVDFRSVAYDAPIEPGDSGAPVFECPSTGRRLVGMVKGKIEDQGRFEVIPMATINTVLAAVETAAQPLSTGGAVLSHPRNAPASGFLDMPRQLPSTPKGRELLAMLSFAGPLRLKRKGGEVTFGLRTADLVIDHPQHRFDIAGTLRGYRSAAGASAVTLMLTETSRQRTTLRIASADPATPLIGAVLGGIDDPTVRLGYAQRQRRAAAEIGADLRPHLAADMITKADGGEMKDKKRQRALADVITALADKFGADLKIPLEGLLDDAEPDNE